ncbi:hypothetical protein [Enterococcus olivae]
MNKTAKWENEKTQSVALKASDSLKPSIEEKKVILDSLQGILSDKKETFKDLTIQDFRRERRLKKRMNS